MNFLSNEEKSNLKRLHKKERDKKVCDRIKAVLLHDKGWSPKQIAEALLISDEAICHHISEYKAKNKLKLESGGSKEKLSKEEAEKLETHLEKHTYLYVKDIVIYVKSHFGIKYSVPGMRNWLERHKFSYKKPTVVPGKANKEEQEKWIREYKRLRERASEKETILFMDGVHPTHNVQPAYGWIRKGKRKDIPSNSGRSRINLSGAINIESHEMIVQTDKTLNTESTIAFLKKIGGAYRDKEIIHIFCDNARYYKNTIVREYLEGSKIELHFLPPYSPNLNPIERVWKWMKERVIYNTYYREFEDFKAAVLGFFKTLSSLKQGSPLWHDFRRRIRDKFRPIQSPLTNF